MAPDAEEAALVFIDGINKYNSKKADKNIPPPHPPPPRCTQRFEARSTVFNNLLLGKIKSAVLIYSCMINNDNSLVAYDTHLHFLNDYSLSVVP